MNFYKTKNGYAIVHDLHKDVLVDGVKAERGESYLQHLPTKVTISGVEEPIVVIDNFIPTNPFIIPMRILNGNYETSDVKFWRTKWLLHTARKYVVKMGGEVTGSSVYSVVAFGEEKTYINNICPSVLDGTNINGLKESAERAYTLPYDEVKSFMETYEKKIARECEIFAMRNVSAIPYPSTHELVTEANHILDSIRGLKVMQKSVSSWNTVKVRMEKHIARLIGE